MLNLLHGVAPKAAKLKQELTLCLCCFSRCVMCRVYHVLSKAPEGWTQGQGRVTDDMMREHFFPAGEDSLGLMCGPPGLLNFVGNPGVCMIYA